MEPRLSGERHSDFTQARLHPLIAPPEEPVPLQAPIHSPRQLPRRRRAHREAPSPERHPVRVHLVLLHALARRPDVIHLVVIVFVQNAHEVLHEEHRVVVPHHEPPRTLRPQLVRLRHDVRYPGRRRPAAEPRRVCRDPYRRTRGVRTGGFRLAVQPDVAADGGGVPPELGVGTAGVPGGGGGSDGEDDVGEGGGARQRGRRRGDFGRGEGAGWAVPVEIVAVGGVEVVGQAGGRDEEEDEERRLRASSESFYRLLLAVLQHFFCLPSNFGVFSFFLFNGKILGGEHGGDFCYSRKSLFRTYSWTLIFVLGEKILGPIRKRQLLSGWTLFCTYHKKNSHVLRICY